jgi:hypothetical protein
MRYAEAGYNLEIDLATGSIERVETDPKLTCPRRLRKSPKTRKED